MELPASGVWTRLAAGGLVIVVLAGLVLAASPLVSLPPGLLAAAWLVVLAGLLTTAVGSWITARRTGASFGGALRRSVGNCWELLRFLF